LGAVPDAGEPLAVYGYLPFPILFLDYKARKKKSLPRWDQLSPWMKLQLIILALEEFEDRFLTFTANINREKSSELMATGADVRIAIRDRIRKHLVRAFGLKTAYFFTIEGTGKRTKAPVGLHIHGGILLPSPSDMAKAKAAIGKGVAQGIRGYGSDPRAIHAKVFYGGKTRYGNYITKFTSIRDERLGSRRLTFSNEAIAAGRSFWELITGRFEGVSLKQLMAEQGLD
jgi:hypothetical protein